MSEHDPRISFEVVVGGDKDKLLGGYVREGADDGRDAADRAYRMGRAELADFAEYAVSLALGSLAKVQDVLGSDALWKLIKSFRRDVAPFIADLRAEPDPLFPDTDD